MRPKELSSDRAIRTAEMAEIERLHEFNEAMKSLAEALSEDTVDPEEDQPPPHEHQDVGQPSRWQSR